MADLARAERLNGLMRLNGYSSRKLAQRIGHSHSTVLRWLEGGSINSDDLVLLAEILLTTTDHITLGRSTAILSEDEHQLLQLFRQQPDHAKPHLIRLLSAYAR